MTAERESGPRALCFVAMPRPRPGDLAIDFAAVYEQVVRAGVRAAGLEPVAVRIHTLEGTIDVPALEQLVLSDFAIVDVSYGRASTYFQLGLRHAVRPYRTVAIHEQERPPDLDGSLVRLVGYRCGDDGRPADPVVDARRLTTALEEVAAAEGRGDFYRVGETFLEGAISRLRTDVFRQRVAYSEKHRAELAAARHEGVGAIDAVRASLGPLAEVEAGVVIDLFLSYRAVKAYDRMIDLHAEMAPVVARTLLVREPLAFALNRMGRDDEAEQLLLDLIAEHGPNSETNGLLGRVYKDRWVAALDAGDTAAGDWLARAIEAYLTGFEADPRDPYPGINALTLMEIADPPDPRRTELLPVVAFAARRRLASGAPDYWDHATMLELAVLAEDEEAARSSAADAIAAVREVWEPESTLSNLRLIRRSRERRGGVAPWHHDIEAGLAQAAAL